MEVLLDTIDHFGVVYPPINMYQVEKEAQELLKSTTILHEQLLSQLDEVLEAFRNAYQAGADINFCSNMRFWRIACDNFLIQRGIYESLMSKYDCTISEKLFCSASE